MVEELRDNADDLFGSGSRSSVVDPFSNPRTSSLAADTLFAVNADPRRRILAKLVWSDHAGLATMFVIFLNLCFIIYETDSRAKGFDRYWFDTVTWIFLAIYAIELTLRIFVERRAFFRGGLNCMEFSIVVGDILVQFVISNWSLPSVSTLRILRAVRLLRVIRAIRPLRELWLMLHGLIGALRSIGWAACLIIIFLLVFSILSVELLHDVNLELAAKGSFPDYCTRCENAFSSIYASSLTWFLLIFGGEHWIDLAIPTMEAYPLTSLLYLMAYVSINLGLLNLVLAVIVDRAHEARQDDHRQIIADKHAAYKRAARQLEKCFGEMDGDGDGQLCLEEVRAGYDENATFKEALDVMDVDRDDIDVIFKILDNDKSGTVNADEFVKNLVKMKTEEVHTMLAFIKHNTADIKVHVDVAVELLQSHVQKEMVLLYEMVRAGNPSIADEIFNLPDKRRRSSVPGSRASVSSAVLDDLQHELRKKLDRLGQGEKSPRHSFSTRDSDPVVSSIPTEHVDPKTGVHL